MGFEIDLATVASVVTNVRAEVTQLSEGIDGEGLETDVTALASAPAPGVAAAVSDYLGLETPVIESIGNRITGCLVGVTTVANLYTTASDEMLQTVQTKAAEAASSGDFSYFGDE